ncbi:MAG: hypothetical protein QXK89_01380 [Candidatus Bathyarchaeia archaeon]|nr:hypothetical protein [Candidatus Bathyarchaeota archaeon]
MPSSNDKRLLLAVYYIVEGVLFFAYSAWRLVINPLRFYRAPPALSGAYVIFILLMFATGVLFVLRALILLKGLLEPGRLDLIASILSMPLWVLPALVAMGNSYYLQIGILFIVIGAFNLLLFILSIYLTRTGYR